MARYEQKETGRSGQNLLLPFEPTSLEKLNDSLKKNKIVILVPGYLKDGTTGNGDIKKLKKNSYRIFPFKDLDFYFSAAASVRAAEHKNGGKNLPVYVASKNRLTSLHAFEALEEQQISGMYNYLAADLAGKDNFSKESSPRLWKFQRDMNICATPQDNDSRPFTSMPVSLPAPPGKKLQLVLTFSTANPDIVHALGCRQNPKPASATIYVIAKPSLSGGDIALASILLAQADSATIALRLLHTSQPTIWQPATA